MQVARVKRINLFVAVSKACIITHKKYHIVGRDQHLKDKVRLNINISEIHFQSK